MDSQESGWKYVDYILLIKDRDNCLAAVNAVTRFRVSQTAGNFSTRDVAVSFLRTLPRGVA
jgi:hypothetical protein